MAEDMRFAVVSARFNSLITERLVAGAVESLQRHGASDAQIDVTWVPGVWELPLACQWVSAQRKPTAIVALACVIRGATSHFDQIVSGATNSLRGLMEREGIPVAHGLLACDSMEDAQARAGLKHGNKGEEAALAALELADLRRRLHGA